MKKLISFLLCIIYIFGIAYGESPATPTDLYEQFDDDDCGCITATLERQVFLQFMHEPKYYGEEVSLVAILVNFLPEDVCTYEWEYSLDGENWILIPDAHKKLYTFIITEENALYYWRVRVHVSNTKPLNLAQLYELLEYRTPLGVTYLKNQVGDCFD